VGRHRVGRHRLGQDRLARGDVEWIDGGKRFLWASERDGWRHIYSVSRDGSDVKNHARQLRCDQCRASRCAERLDLLLASPENATQRYLYRVRIDGTGKEERLTPRTVPGVHSYNISPRGDFAIHFTRASTAFR
jgi:dipeptidyl-peptidase-4